jgi:hypothetical protein
MIQNLKKETCTGECYPKCPIYNILQRRIGNWKVQDKNTIEGMARYIQKERCPDSATLDTTNLNTARQKPN